MDIPFVPPIPSPTPNYAQDFLDTVRRRYEEFRRTAKENQLPVIRYYTLHGAEIRIAEIHLYENSTLLFQGEDQDGTPCDVIAQPQSAQLVLKLLTFREPVPEDKRRPIGFRVIDTDEHTEGET